MRRFRAAATAVVLASGTVLAIAAPATASPASPVEVTADKPSEVAPSDSLPNPAADEQSKLREQAITAVLNGEATPQEINGSTVVDLGETIGSAVGQLGKYRQYVELEREKTDKIFVILADFGNERHPDYPDQDTNPDIAGPSVFDGPLNNAIPEPDRSVDNTTNWRPNYDQAYFQDLYFGEGKGVESLKTYYEAQSSGRYSVDGTVTDWVTVPYNEARYGRSDYLEDATIPEDGCTDNICENTWELVKDAANVWYDDQLAAGRPVADVNAELKSFDQWDRYDYDKDGDFNESDGYIDHFQIVHAGGDQSNGDPYQGEDAIWAHRWATFQNGLGKEGPADNLHGGNQIGDSGIWISDYTMQAENGGRSVFFHEFGHDLGLPDAYDTVTGANQNTFWTIMAQSRLAAKGEPGIGDRGGDLGAWEKLQLGWLDYTQVKAGARKTLLLGPEEYNTRMPQALIVTLPKKVVHFELGEPFSGEKQFYSGSALSFDSSMARTVDVPADGAELSFQTHYNIEDCGDTPCDYAYVQVDDGTGWTAIPGSIANPDEGNGIDGLQEDWIPATFDLSAYAGQTVGLRVAYSTDSGTSGSDEEQRAGIWVDDIAITDGGGAVVFSDDAETDTGWELNRFVREGAEYDAAFDNYYIAAYRTYQSYDKYLKTGPYAFGFPDRPDFIEHYAYQRGLLISYWDTSQNDNNVGVHPGEGRNLYFDAHPETLFNKTGGPWGTSVNLYDAAFSRYAPSSLSLHIPATGELDKIKSQGAQPVFDDTRDYFDPILIAHGVYGADAGVKIKIQLQSLTMMIVTVGKS